MTTVGSNQQLTGILDNLVQIPKVRAVFIATAEGALADGHGSGLPRDTTDDIAKTVQRMAMASTTVSAPMHELTINFGPGRVFLCRLRDDVTLALHLERGAELSEVRSWVEKNVAPLQQLLESAPEEIEPSEGFRAEPDDEIARLFESDLGPTLQETERLFSRYVMRSGATRTESRQFMREQMREWLLCCSPAVRTIPLLLDGLAQIINERDGERLKFLAEVQSVVQRALESSGEGGM